MTVLPSFVMHIYNKAPLLETKHPADASWCALAIQAHIHCIMCLVSKNRLYKWVPYVFENALKIYRNSAKTKQITPLQILMWNNFSERTYLGHIFSLVGIHSKFIKISEFHCLRIQTRISYKLTSLQLR